MDEEQIVTPLRRSLESLEYEGFPPKYKPGTLFAYRDGDRDVNEIKMVLESGIRLDYSPWFYYRFIDLHNHKIYYLKGPGLDGTDPNPIWKDRYVFLYVAE